MVMGHCGALLANLISVVIREIQLRLLSTDLHTGSFSHHFTVDRLTGLYPHDELVSLELILREYVTRYIFKLNPYLRLPLIQC